MSRLSDHEIIGDDSYKSWNIWCPGTPGVNMSAYPTVDSNGRETNLAKMEERMQLVADKLVEQFNAGVNIIGLQEVPDPSSNKQYFDALQNQLKTHGQLGKALAAQLERNYTKTGTHRFGTVTLYHPEKFSMVGTPVACFKTPENNCRGQSLTLEVKGVLGSEFNVLNFHGDFKYPKTHAEELDKYYKENKRALLVFADSNIRKNDPDPTIGAGPNDVKESHGLARKGLPTSTSTPVIASNQADGLNTLDFFIAANLEKLKADLKKIPSHLVPAQSASVSFTPPPYSLGNYSILGLEKQIPSNGDKPFFLVKYNSSAQSRIYFDGNVTNSNGAPLHWNSPLRQNLENVLRHFKVNLKELCEVRKVNPKELCEVRIDINRINKDFSVIDSASASLHSYPKNRQKRYIHSRFFRLNGKDKEAAANALYGLIFKQSTARFTKPMLEALLEVNSELRRIAQELIGAPAVMSQFDIACSRMKKGEVLEFNQNGEGSIISSTSHNTLRP